MFSRRLLSFQLLPNDRKLTSNEIMEPDKKPIYFDMKTASDPTVFNPHPIRPDNVEPAPVRGSVRVGLQDSTLVYLCQPNQFSSAFWIERKWIFELAEIDREDIIYSIRTYRYIKKSFLLWNK